MRDSKLKRKILKLSEQNVKIRTEIVVSDSKTRKQENKKTRKQASERASEITNKQASKVFSYWAEGELNSPPIVRMCINSQRQAYPDSYVFLDDSCIEDWIEVPEVIRKKRTCMSTTHYSDVIRLLLLKEHGGTWLDSTVFVTNKLEIKNGSFFAFTRPGDPFLLSSWYLQSMVPNNYLISKWLDSLLNYWSANTSLSDYFLLHYLFEANYHQDRKFKKIWSAREFYSFEEPHLLQSILLEKFDKANLDLVIAKSGIHKLTWKLPDQQPDDCQLKYLLRSY